ncbi:CIS tube protein [Azospirillum sp. sgz302134]
MTSGLEKMTIIAYEDESFSIPAGLPFVVFINPASYKCDYEICFNTTSAQGSSTPSHVFNRMGPASISFDLAFDATGVVPSLFPGLPDAPPDGVFGIIELFKRQVLKFDGSIHSPRYVKLFWGQLLYKCQLKTLSIDYTLFRPDGVPLRAKASVQFVSFTSKKQAAKEANRSSPDLTHVVTVKAGDSLPTLCYRVYGSSLHYLRVAEFNGLNSFRRLVPGTRLLFPPLPGPNQ